MLMKEMFEKEIDRDIQGVIIVGQSEAENVAQELDEYVVTKELQKYFADFFSAYSEEVFIPYRFNIFSAPPKRIICVS